MKAKEVPRIRLEGRTKLHDAIPLDTPIHVFIDPSAACNFRCKFCFHGNGLADHHEIMSWELFVKIVAQLKEFPRKIKAVRLYGFGEPLLNTMMPEMVRYLHTAGVTDFVEFTTNGWALNPGLNRELVDAGLDAMTISVPGLSNSDIYKACGKHVNFDYYIASIKDFYNRRESCRLHVKITNFAIGKGGDASRFYRIFGDICDEISVDNVVPIWPGIKGKAIESNKNIYMGEIEPVRVCPYIFYHLTIHANGDVSTCFVDWNHENLLGNVNVTTIKEIWEGNKLYFIRMNQLKGVKEGICVDCPQLVYGQPDSIDDYALEIAGRM